MPCHPTDSMWMDHQLHTISLYRLATCYPVIIINSLTTKYCYNYNKTEFRSHVENGIPYVSEMRKLWIIHELTTIPARLLRETNSWWSCIMKYQDTIRGLSSGLNSTNNEPVVHTCREGRERRGGEGGEGGREKGGGRRERCTHIPHDLPPKVKELINDITIIVKS